MGVQTPLREIIKKLKTWQSNPTWSAGRAAKELNTKKPTILAWKKKYWADLDRITDPGDRMRQPGGGRKHKMASFEWAVVEFYDSCLLQDGAVRRADIFDYCSRIDEFAVRKHAWQRTWVNRFMQRYYTRSDLAAPASPDVVGTNAHSEDGSTTNESAIDAQLSGQEEAMVTIEGPTVTMENPGVTTEGPAVTMEESSVTNERPTVITERTAVIVEEVAIATDALESCIVDSDSEAQVVGDAPVEEDKHVLLQKASSEVIDVDEEPERHGYTLRHRINTNAPLFEHLKTPKAPDTATKARLAGVVDPTPVPIFLFEEDFLSLEDGKMVSNAVADLCITKYFEKDSRIYSAASAMFSEMNYAYANRDSREQSANGITGDFDWNSYTFVQLPVVLNKHWSFLVIENPVSADEATIYHVNSLKGCHAPDHLFAVVEWFLGQVTGAAVQAATYNYVTKPRQVNASNCALYVLHYMRATHKFVTKRRPSSLLEYMPSLVQSRYNVSKAAASRKAIRARLTRLQQQNS